MHGFWKCCKIGTSIGIFVALSSCYVTRLAFQQNALINSRRPIERVLQDPAVESTTKERLRLTRNILKFAERNGLNVDGAYDYYIHLKGRSVSYIVQAAEADRLEAVTWWFPVVGRVPYLGFFDQEDRDEKASELAKAGYDVEVGGVSAFSSLGWFDDPIYSSMLNRPPAELAHLLFHELTHRTLWVKGSVPFNENLAEFVADKLTKDWLFAENRSAEIDAYLKRRRDREQLTMWVIGLKNALAQAYREFPQARPLLPADRQRLLQRKQQVFEEWLTTKKPKFEATDLIGKAGDWNHATVLGASLYSPETVRFEKAWSCRKPPSIGAFLQDLDLANARISRNTETDAAAKVPFLALDSFCQP